jgi:hypothetical protein
MHAAVFVIARKSFVPRARHTNGAMKRSTPTDPLEETMENPDLPPLAVAPASAAPSSSRPPRRSPVMRTLILGALLLTGLLIALRVIAG